MKSIIQVDHCSYGYPVSTPEEPFFWVLNDIDLTIPEGEFLSIMGPTDSGKTTFCLALTGIVPQSTGGRIRGEIIVDGFNSKYHPIPQITTRIGIVFQEPETQLFNSTVEEEIAFGLENLGLPREEIARRIEWALTTVDMESYRQYSPHQLSGGQKQRVAIASILAMRPKIIILDEPTASLDPLGKSEVFSVVKSLRDRYGITFIMVSQDSEHVAKFSDRVAIMDHGKFILAGTPEEIFNRVGFLHDIGVFPPPVSHLAPELNIRFNTDYHFFLLEQAAQQIRQKSPWTPQ